MGFFSEGLIIMGALVIERNLMVQKCLVNILEMMLHVKNSR